MSCRVGGIAQGSGCLLLGAGACVQVRVRVECGGCEVEVGTGLGGTEGFAGAIGDAGPYSGKVGRLSGAAKRSRTLHVRFAI